MKQFRWAVVSAFGLLVTASPVPGTPRYNVNSRSTVTTAEVTNLQFFAQYAGASYCNSEDLPGSTVNCSENVCPDVTAAGAKVVATFHGDITDIQGFVSSDDKNELIVASFKGSESIRNWITDLSFIAVSCDLVDGCLVHAGFLTAYNEIKDDLMTALNTAKEANPSYKTVFTGHSLGAAVATVAVANARNDGYDADLITYGSPRVGNKEFVSFVTNQSGAEYRVTHLDDPVPRLPPIIFGYRHTSPEYWLSDGSANTTIYKASDIKVCDGFANTDCNAGTHGLDIDAHRYYFEHIGACGEDGISFKPRDVTYDMATTEPKDISDEELLAQLDDWVEKDREFSETLNE
ncbi:alpha/beta-hydrolase [Hypoxylon sp. FL0890]|nr:alpha/beta-hydrolase [Hypoxylon sp. FL0890]